MKTRTILYTGFPVCSSHLGYYFIIMEVASLPFNILLTHLPRRFLSSPQFVFCGRLRRRRSHAIPG